MLFQTIKKWFHIYIPINLEKNFDVEIGRINLFRGKITSLLFLFMELFLIAILLCTKTNNFELRTATYLGMYIFMAISMIINYIIFSILEKNIEKNVNKIKIIGITFPSYILIWCAAISMMDQHSSGQIIVYISAIMSIAIFPFLHPLNLFFIFLVVHSVFIILLPHFQKSNDVLFGIYINSTLLIIISLIISRELYKGKLNDFINRYTIEEKNTALKNMNLELIEVNKKLEQLSFTDGLTGLLNRRKLDEVLNTEWQRSICNSIPISLIMVDIDFFKRYNDFYGHQAGDNCIRLITSTMSKAVRRSTDIIARYGGEEFLIVLLNTENEAAFQIAEHIRTSIEILQIPHKDSSVSDYVTISLGVCTVIPTEGFSLSEFLHSVDNALYKAKATRNISIKL